MFTCPKKDLKETAKIPARVILGIGSLTLEREKHIQGENEVTLLQVINTCAGISPGNDVKESCNEMESGIKIQIKSKWEISASCAEVRFPPQSPDDLLASNIAKGWQVFHANCSLIKVSFGLIIGWPQLWRSRMAGFWCKSLRFCHCRPRDVGGPSVYCYRSWFWGDLGDWVNHSKQSHFVCWTEGWHREIFLRLLSQKGSNKGNRAWEPFFC